MARNLGRVERIEGKQVTINGVVKGYNKPIKFKVGDWVEYRINKNPSKNRYDTIAVTGISTEEGEGDRKELLDEVVEESYPGEEERGVVSYEEYRRCRGVKDWSEKLIREFILGDGDSSRFDFSDLSGAQFQSFHSTVARYNYNFNSKGIGEYIETRIGRGIGKGFYRSFNESFIEKLEELYGMPEFSQIKEDKNLLNRELFLLLKKYYRYEEAKKFIGGAGSEF